MRRYLIRNYNLAHGIEDPEMDDAASDGRPATAASLGTMLENLKFELAVSTDEIHGSPPEGSAASIHLPEPSDAQPGPNTTAEPQTTKKKKSLLDLRPHAAQAAPILPPEYGSSTPTSARLPLPVPAVPSAVTRAGSVRSARSSSTVSTGTGSARSAYGSASSTLRGFLAGSVSKERRRVEAMRPVCVSDDKPPQLDWAPPKLDLQELQ